MSKQSFPPRFVWGAATASYQIEGGWNEDGRGESIWDRFTRTPGKIIDNSTGDVACDHYHRWREDIALMKELGLQAYRFSIAWPRILPEGRGRINEAGLDFYDRLVDGLLNAGITPWATLYHWDLPQILEDQGGWPNRATAEAFAELADAVSRRIGDRVKHWITINEPWCAAFLGYHSGVHAPGRTSLRDAVHASHTLLLAHGLSVPVLRQNSPGAQIGITLNMTHVYPATESAEDQAAGLRLDGFINRWWLDPLYGRGYPQDMLALYNADLPIISADDLAAIAAPTDFLGVNFYSPSLIQHRADGSLLQLGDAHPADSEYTGMDWLIYPQGLRDLLLRLGRDYPVGGLYITENGASYPDSVTESTDGGPRVADPQRTSYYQRHIAAAHEAIAGGAPLKGYFAWSLMDNFEWSYGYAKRFGLIYVDYTTQRRILKDSGHWYRDLLQRQRSFAAEPVAVEQQA